MPILKTNFRHGPVGAISGLPLSGAASYIAATGQFFISGSALFVWAGDNFKGFSAVISASGS